MPYVRTRLGRWFYEERGEPRRPDDPAIVLLHGLLFDGAMWSKQTDPLARLGRVLVLDGPAHGRSEPPPPFTLEDHADALMSDALTELRVGRAILVGLSWGGMVAMRAALRYPDRIAALGLFDTSAAAEPRARALKYRAFVSLTRRYGAPGWLVQRQISPIMFAPASLEERPELASELAKRVNGYPRDGMARVVKAVVVYRTSVLDRLKEIRVPTLVAVGREDRATEPARAQEIAARIPGARLVFIEGAGHSPPVERPAETTELLASFVEGELARG